MALPPLPRLRPGQTPTAAEWNLLTEHLERTLGTASGAAFGEVGLSRGGGGLSVLDGREKGHWAKVTSRGTGNNYAHQQAIPKGDGTFLDMPASGADSIWGTATRLPLHEVNGRVDIDDTLPLYVRVWPDFSREETPCFLFEYPGPTGFIAELTAVLTDGSGVPLLFGDGTAENGLTRWKWRRLDYVEFSSGTRYYGPESADYTAWAVYRRGNVLALAGSLVWMWPHRGSYLESNQIYKCIAYGNADGLNGGFVTTVDQVMGNGDKRFRRRVTVNLDGAADDDTTTPIVTGVDVPTGQALLVRNGGVSSGTGQEAYRPYAVFAAAAGVLGDDVSGGARSPYPFAQIGDVILSNSGEAVTPYFYTGASLPAGRTSRGTPLSVAGYVVCPEFRVQFSGSMLGGDFTPVTAGPGDACSHTGRVLKVGGDVAVNGWVGVRHGTAAIGEGEAGGGFRVFAAGANPSSYYAGRTRTVVLKDMDDNPVTLTFRDGLEVYPTPLFCTEGGSGSGWDGTFACVSGACVPTVGGPFASAEDCEAGCGGGGACPAPTVTTVGAAAGTPVGDDEGTLRVTFASVTLGAGEALVVHAQGGGVGTTPSPVVALSYSAGTVAELFNRTSAAVQLRTFLVTGPGTADVVVDNAYLAIARKVTNYAGAVDTATLADGAGVDVGGATGTPTIYSPGPSTDGCLLYPVVAATDDSGAVTGTWRDDFTLDPLAEVEVHTTLGGRTYKLTCTEILTTTTGTSVSATYSAATADAWVTATGGIALA